MFTFVLAFFKILMLESTQINKIMNIIQKKNIQNNKNNNQKINNNNKL